MRIVLQRVRSASVDVEGEEVGAIGKGILALVGVEQNDDEATAARSARKLGELRIFPDEEGRMNCDAAQANGAFLVVSQFTLAATLDSGRRPSFARAASPETARSLIDLMIVLLREAGFTVASGRFGSLMQVRLVNDGPVTFVLEV